MQNSAIGLDINETLNKPENTPSALPKLERQRLHDTVVEHLRNLIVEAVLVPGTKLNERELCETLGISRTPLREALKVLAAEGLIEISPNRGASVSKMSETEIWETFELMSGLEAMSGELACERITPVEVAEIKALHYAMLACKAQNDLPGYYSRNQTIHNKINEAARNSVLHQTYLGLNRRLQALRFKSQLFLLIIGFDCGRICSGDRHRHVQHRIALVQQMLAQDCRQALAVACFQRFDHLVVIVRGAVPFFGAEVGFEAQRLQTPVQAEVGLMEHRVARGFVDLVVDGLVAAVVAGQVVLRFAGQHGVVQRLDLGHFHRRDAFAGQLAGHRFQAAHEFEGFPDLGFGHL